MGNKNEAKSNLFNQTVELVEQMFIHYLCISIGTWMKLKTLSCPCIRHLNCLNARFS